MGWAGLTQNKVGCFARHLRILMSNRSQVSTIWPCFVTWIITLTDMTALITAQLIVSSRGGVESASKYFSISTVDPLVSTYTAVLAALWTGDICSIIRIFSTARTYDSRVTLTSQHRVTTLISTKM